MEKLFFGILIVILLLAIPYFYKIYSLKKITEEDLPDSGSWVNLSRGNIYFQWHTPEVSEPLKGTIVLVHGFSTPSFVWGGLLNLNGTVVAVLNGISKDCGTKVDGSNAVDSRCEFQTNIALT